MPALYKDTDSGIVLVDRGAVGLRIMSGFFAIMGMVVVLSIVGVIPSESRPESFSGEWLGVFGIGAAFLSVSSAAFFYRNYFEFDFRHQEVRHIKGFHSIVAARYALSNFREVIVLREKDTDSDSSNDYLYPVLLRGEGQEDVVLGKYIDVSDALDIARVISSRGGIKAVDSVLGGGKDFSITSTEKIREIEIHNLSSVYPEGIQFSWDGNGSSYSRLFSGRHSGGMFYKIEYFVTLWPNLIGIGFTWGFYYYIFGNRQFQAVVQFIESGEPIRFVGMSAETFFVTIISSFFFLFLVLMPVFSLLKKMVSRKPFELIGALPTGLVLYSLHAPFKWGIRGLKKGKALRVSYDDVHNLTVKAEDRPKWKIMKMENCIGIRLRDKFIEIGKGLDSRQLNQIADEIRRYIKS